MSALGHKRTYAVQKSMSALPLIATVKADTEADAVPKTRAPGAPVGSLDGESYAQIRGITLAYE
jgi:hypothetical protein